VRMRSEGRARTTRARAARRRVAAEGRESIAGGGAPVLPSGRMLGDAGGCCRLFPALTPYPLSLWARERGADAGGAVSRTLAPLSRRRERVVRRSRTG